MAFIHDRARSKAPLRLRLPKWAPHQLHLLNNLGGAPACLESWREVEMWRSTIP